MTTSDISDKVAGLKLLAHIADSLSVFRFHKIEIWT